METTINQRIKKIVDMSGKNVSAYAAEIGVSQPTLSACISGANAPRFDTLQKILIGNPMISAEWLMRGGNDDGMFKSKNYGIGYVCEERPTYETPSKNEKEDKEEDGSKSLIIDNEEDYLSAKEKGLKLIPEIDFKLVGGEKQLFGSDTVMRYWHLPDCNDCDMIVQVVGDSMAPNYPSGCWVALKKYTLPSNPNSIPFGNVFGIVVKDDVTGETHAYIKILRRHKNEEMAKEYWVAHSINTESYDDFDIKIESVVGLWVVKQHVVSDML